MDLIPVRQMVPPECAPVLLVQIFERTVFLLQEFMEFPDAQITAARFAVVLVADVPACQRGMGCIPFGQFPVDLPDLFPEDGGGQAVVLTVSPEIASSVRTDFAAFRIFLPEPCRFRGRWRG